MGGSQAQQQTRNRHKSQGIPGKKRSTRQLRDSVVIDDDIRRLQNQVTQLSLECKVLQQARDMSVVVAEKMVKEIERLEGILESQRKLKEPRSKSS